MKKSKEMLKSLDIKELKNCKIHKVLSGYNNQVCFFSSYNNQKKIKKFCLKYSLRKKNYLELEANILYILNSHKFSTPKILNSRLKKKDNFQYILMTALEGKTINKISLQMKDIFIILDKILLHESILENNLRKLKCKAIIKNYKKKIDFKKKILNFFLNYVPNFALLNSIEFLNKNLNSKKALNFRKIITDRSSENILKKKNGEIFFLDFSTIRIGSGFDNWIQFIDDPRINFPCSRKKLVEIFLKRNNLKKSDLKLFYTASVYTNLLQAIFTYNKNKKMGTAYIKKVNNAFSKLNNKKSVLISINHQYALK